MSISQNIKNFLEDIPGHVKLVAISKTKPEKDILEAYNSGHKIFGENRVQEFVKKYEELPKDIEWHMVGHLQSNKVKYIASFVHLIHAVDSYRLLKIINKEAITNGRIIGCLLQIHIAKEETKFGFSMDEVIEMLKSTEFRELKNVQITGLMGMATFSDDEELIRSEFKYLKNCYNELKNTYFNNCTFFKELSMGMSGDYKVAIEEGSTMVRIGSIIFGVRNH